MAGYRRDQIMVCEAGFDPASFPPDGYRWMLLTVTLPSFAERGAPVHIGGSGHGGPPRRCPCGRVHPPHYPLSGVPLDLDRYDYAAAAAHNVAHGVLANCLFSKLRSRWRDVQFFYVFELQARLAVHLHAVLRFPASGAPEAGEVCSAASGVRSRRYGVSWGQADCRPLLVSDGGRTSRYVAKYLGKDLYAERARDSSMLSGPDRRRLGLFRSRLIDAVAACPMFDALSGWDRGCPVHRVGLAPSDQDGRVCTCPRNPIHVKGADRANFGMGRRLVGRSRGWSSVTVSSLRRGRAEWRRNMVAERVGVLAAAYDSGDAEGLEALMDLDDDPYGIKHDAAVLWMFRDDGAPAV